MGFIKGIKSRLKESKWRSLVIVALIFVLAFGIRAYLFRYDLMFEFDTYWHTRMTGEIIQHGVPPAVDPLAYYQLEGGSPIPLRTQLFWYISAFFYFIAALFTTGSFAYNKLLLIQVVKFLPAFYGALVAVGMYFLGKEAYGKKAGYLMGFFGAVSASFIYRSMAGFYEAGTLGYVFMIFGFYFVLRAVKRMQNTRQMIVNGAIAAVLLGLLAQIYALFMIVPLVSVFYLIFTVLELVGRNQFAQAIRFSQLLVGILGGFVLLTLVAPNPQWIQDMIGLVLQAIEKVGFLLPLLVLLTLTAIGGIVFFFVSKRPQITKTKTSSTPKNWLAIAKPLLLYAVLLGAFVLMITPKTVTNAISAGVGEESQGHLYFFHKFGILIIFPLLALVLMPLIDWKKKQLDWASMLLFPFILISLYMAWDRLHYSYNLGVPLAIAGGYLLVFAINFLRSRPRSERAIAGITIGFLVLSGVASATLFTMNNTPTIEVDTGWKEGLAWLYNNSSIDAKLFNWWDEGHWIAFLAERKVITDNRNYSREANEDVGKFVLTEDLNEAIRILQKYDSDYLVLGADLFSKRNSMVLYAFYQDKPLQRNDPRLDSIFSFQVPCSQADENTAIVFKCGSGTIPESQMNQIPTTWTANPSTIENNRNPIFYYRTTDNARLYKLSLKQNQTVFAKIWFHAPAVALYFEEVFPDNLPDYKNKELKIFKINKNKFSS